MENYRHLAVMVMALFVTAPLLAQSTDNDDDERARTVYQLAPLVEIAPGADTRLEAALEYYNREIGGQGGTITPEKMAGLYAAAGGDAYAFKTIALLIDKGVPKADVAHNENIRDTQISEEHSRAMAQMREGRIEGAIGEVLKKRGPNFRLARSDSGNLSSGMKSDVDQTFYAFEYKEGIGWVRRRDLDGEMMREFIDAWNQTEPRLSMDAMDVATIEGRDRFPDPREVKIDFETEYRRVTEALRSTPGAYTYHGAVSPQMQFRVLGAILSDNPNPRVYQMYGEGPDGKVGPMGFDADAAHRYMFGVTPELLPAHAFGAAMANYVELLKYMHKEKFETKYHLRVWEDSGQVLALEDRQRTEKGEYLSMDAAERERMNQRIIDQMFADPQKRKMHRMAMQISADLRNLHKGDLDAVFPNGAPDVEAREAAVFDALAREMFGDKVQGDPTPEQIKAAVEQHRQLAAEFCLESIHRSAAEAYRVSQDPQFRQPFEVENYRHLLSGIPEAEWPKVSRNMQTAARISLLYGIYDLGPRKSWELLGRLNEQFPDMRFTERIGLWMRGSLQGLEGVVRDEAARQKIRERGMTRVAELNSRVQRHIAVELGFTHVEEARIISGIMETSGLRWSPAAFVKNMAMDPGNIDALAQVLRTYFETEGDMEAVKAKALDELILAIPVAGQLVALTRGGISGAVLMAGAIQFPALGVALIVYSVGEAGYAIYDVEYARHAEGNIHEAIYRGFVGPALRAYDNVPDQFTDEDQVLLDDLPRRIEMAEAGRDVLLLRELRDQLAVLKAKKAAFKEYRDGSWAGGYFTQAGAQLQQKKFELNLMLPFDPIISFSPGGIIDFRAKDVSEQIADLNTQIEAATDAREFLTLAAQLEELNLEQARYERAKRYLDRATGEDGKPPSLELLYKLKRDSVYPNLLRIAEAGRIAGPNTDEYVDLWWSMANEGVAQELESLGLVDFAFEVYDERMMNPSVRFEEQLDKLKSHLETDYTRSRVLYREYEKREKTRREANELRLANRIAAYEAQATGVWLEGLENDPDFEHMSDLILAMRLAAVRRNPPRINATVYIIRHASDEQSEEEQSLSESGEGPTVRTYRENLLDEDFDIYPRISVTTDPNLYIPPYTSVVSLLDRPKAEQALSSGKVDGIPLLPSTVELLKQTVPGLPQPDPERPWTLESYIALVHVFATGMADLSHALPDTVSHLPGYNQEPTEHGVLMGQTISTGNLMNETEREESFIDAGEGMVYSERLPNGMTAIYVTAEDIALLDSEVEGGMLLAVHWEKRQYPDGPVIASGKQLFTEVENEIVEPPQVDAQTRNVENARVGEDRVMLIDRGDQSVEFDVDPLMPFSYRATLHWTYYGDSDRGEPQSSEWSTPREPAVEVEMRESDDGEPTLYAYYDSRREPKWVTIHAMAVQSDQPYAYAGGAIEATSGTFTGRYFVPGLHWFYEQMQHGPVRDRPDEFSQWINRYGDDARRSLAYRCSNPGWAEVRVPYKPGGMTVRLSFESDSGEGETTVEIPPLPEVDAKLAEELGPLRGELSEHRRYGSQVKSIEALEQKIANAAEEIAKTEKRIAEAEPRRVISTADGPLSDTQKFYIEKAWADWFSAQQYLLQLRGMQAFTLQVEKDKLQDEVELKIAELERNWPAAVAVLQRQAARLAPGGPRMAQDMQFLEQLHQFALVLAQKKDELGRDEGGHAAATTAAWAAAKPLVAATYAHVQYEVLEQLRDAAQLAGNRAVMLDAHQRMQELAEQYCEDPAEKAGDPPAGYGPNVGWYLIGIDRWSTIGTKGINHWYAAPGMTRYMFHISPTQQVAESIVTFGGDRERAAKMWYDDFEHQLATIGNLTAQQQQEWRDKLFLGEQRARRLLLPPWWPPVESTQYPAERGQDETPPGLKEKPGTISFW